ncbi:Ankyrin repeat-containing domain [Penicillium roqueforti FM164]|uniref:Ankyrin repeat-containing domain n=1 Tax=Penicillium roqueforti (strain FM164) TaxID=1365484 RepID=W6QR11_PENRF|nr:Ankyrin repeat-containing domain [Penicillium roqueforti FM164]
MNSRNEMSLPNPDKIEQISILDCPTETLWIIASTLEGGDISALARTNSILYPKLRLALIEYNIRYQNSSALHWAAKQQLRLCKDLAFLPGRCECAARWFLSLMTAANYGSELVTNILLRKKDLHVNWRNTNGESALWYSVVKESPAVLNQLLQHPSVKIDLPNREGQTVLWWEIDMRGQLFLRTKRYLQSCLLTSQTIRILAAFTHHHDYMTLDYEDSS